MFKKIFEDIFKIGSGVATMDFSKIFKGFLDLGGMATSKMKTENKKNIFKIVFSLEKIKLNIRHQIKKT